MSCQMNNKSDEEFYSDAAQYWADIPATIDGMLGGFGHISQIDIRSSKLFLKQLFSCKAPPGRNYALDCGAGIGRITKFLLTDLFKKVDLVEQNPLFLEQAKKYIGPQSGYKIGNYYPVGLQNFEPEPKKYDVIWIQWVLGHLTDKDFISFLKVCQKGLKENGFIVVKENITSSDDIELDEHDSSVTRSMSLLKQLFSRANLECYRQMKQNNFPKGIYSVYMFALRPCDISEESTKESDVCINDLTNLVKSSLTSLAVETENNIKNTREDDTESIENINLDKTKNNGPECNISNNEKEKENSDLKLEKPSQPEKNELQQPKGE